jgi:acetyl esterase
MEAMGDYSSFGDNLSRRQVFTAHPGDSMPLHPQAQAMIDAFARSPALDYSRLTADDFRAMFKVPAPSASGPDLVRVEDRSIAGAAGPMRVRLYRPPSSSPLPITVYFHGGGFVIGDPETTDEICRTLAAGAETLVVSPDYRLAPEAPFPCGLEDAWVALCWAQDHAREIGGAANQVAVAGDSSGGNFAAAIAQMARDGQRPLCHQLLLYPVLDGVGEADSWAEFASGFFLTAEMMRWFWRQYCPHNGSAEDWRASPARRPDLESLPAATIFTAEYDILRDEAEAYAVRLRGAGVPTMLKRWHGQIHGFLLQQGTIDDAALALDEASRALKAAFAP